MLEIRLDKACVDGYGMLSIAVGCVSALRDRNPVVGGGWSAPCIRQLAHC